VKGTKEGGICSHIELNFHFILNVIHLWNAGLSTKWARGAGGVRHVQTRQGGMLKIKIKLRRRTATHFLRDFMHVSESNGGQKAHGNSRPGRNFMSCTSANQTWGQGATHKLEGISWVARQRFKWRSGGARQLTYWKGFHGLHVSDSNGGQEVHGNSLSKGFHVMHVSDSNRGQEVHSNSQAGRDFM